MVDTELVQRAKVLLDQLCEKPRFAGSEEESTARDLCREELERAGFQCEDRQFAYSQWPGRWGPSLAVAVQTTAIILVADTAMRGEPFSALLTGAAILSGLFFADANAKQKWITNFPLQRARSVNLEARRGKARVWLVAHLDTKSQTVPMLLRIASTIALAAVTFIAGGMLLLTLMGLRAIVSFWPVVEIAAIISGLPSLLCFVRNDSSGAVDNGSGVVAVLLAAASSDAPKDLGVLITSGEELGLVGARVWAPGAPDDSRVLNCDTVDDRGGWRCMYSGRKPSRITAAAGSVAGQLRLVLPVGRVIPGVLADHIAFADQGIEAVTLSRGTLATLARIHTRRDNSNALTGMGAAEASALLSALARELS